MSTATSIEWTDATWNPVRGCSRVSEGCRNCYAERSAVRQKDAAYAGLVRSTPSGPRWTGAVRLVPELLDQPLRWRKLRRIFVNSMSDLFHEKVSDAEIGAIFGVMLMSERHTFQVLTKRPDRMRRWFEWIAGNPVSIGTSAKTATKLTGGPAASCLALLRAIMPAEAARGHLFTAALLGGIEPKEDAPIRALWPLPNVWLGVSLEDQQRADERIPSLLETPAAVRFVSYEPALGPVDFGPWIEDGDPTVAITRTEDIVEQARLIRHGAPRLDWVIVGGESGPDARLFDISWARQAVRQCRKAGVPVFVKQMGSCAFDLSLDLGCCAESRIAKSDRKGGDPSEWPEDLRVREMPVTR